MDYEHYVDSTGWVVLVQVEGLGSYKMGIDAEDADQAERLVLGAMRGKSTRSMFARAVYPYVVGEDSDCLDADDV